MAKMRAARLHEPGKPFRIDTIDVPEPRPGDVLVKVAACGIIPNMNAIVSGKFWHHLPRMPAVIGLDAAGTVVAAPEGRSDIRAGDRVYVNPFLNCGQCHYCRSGTPLLCADAALRGYFGFTPRGAELLEDYPYGGLSEYLTAASQHLVKLPPEVSFELGARFGYLGTSFAALRRGGAGAGSWIAIHGITGTLGVGAVLLALAMGATRILGWGRSQPVLARLGRCLGQAHMRPPEVRGEVPGLQGRGHGVDWIAHADQRSASQAAWPVVGWVEQAGSASCRQCFVRAASSELGPGEQAPCAAVIGRRGEQDGQQPGCLVEPRHVDHGASAAEISGDRACVAHSIFRFFR